MSPSLREGEGSEWFKGVGCVCESEPVILFQGEGTEDVGWWLAEDVGWWWAIHVRSHVQHTGVALSIGVNEQTLIKIESRFSLSLTISNGKASQHPDISGCKLKQLICTSVHFAFLCCHCSYSWRRFVSFLGSFTWMFLGKVHPKKMSWKGTWGRLFIALWLQPAGHIDSPKTAPNSLSSALPQMDMSRERWTGVSIVIHFSQGAHQGVGYCLLRQPFTIGLKAHAPCLGLTLSNSLDQTFSLTVYLKSRVFQDDFFKKLHALI